MTADIVQNKLIQKRQAVPMPTHHSRGTWGKSFDVFGFLKREETRDTQSLLKAAYKKLRDAEAELAQKSQRIEALEKIITVDELSNLTNRRGFYSRFAAELERTNRGENEGGLLVMIDLDHFKTINDTFGHRAGDEAIKLVGHFLKHKMRQMDCAARLGGDEFIILMPNTNAEKAYERAHEIGHCLNSISYVWEGKKIHIRASLGLKEYKKGDTIESIIEEADQNMYEKKEIKKRISQ